MPTAHYFPAEIESEQHRPGSRASSPVGCQWQSPIPDVIGCLSQPCIRWAVRLVSCLHMPVPVCLPYEFKALCESAWAERADDTSTCMSHPPQPITCKRLLVQNQQIAYLVLCRCDERDWPCPWHGQCRALWPPWRPLWSLQTTFQGHCRRSGAPVRERSLH